MVFFDYPKLCRVCSKPLHAPHHLFCSQECFRKFRSKQGNWFYKSKEFAKSKRGSVGRIFTRRAKRGKPRIEHGDGAYTA